MSRRRDRDVEIETRNIEERNDSSRVASTLIKYVAYLIIFFGFCISLSNTYFRCSRRSRWYSLKSLPFVIREREVLSWIGIFHSKLYLSQAIHPSSCDQIYFATGIIKSSSLVSSSDQLASSS